MFVSQSPSGTKEVQHPHGLSQQMSGPRCIARFDYEAVEAEDLGFVAGDVIQLKDYVAEDWLRGELKGKIGVFPLAFVEIIEHLPSSQSTGNYQIVLALQGYGNSSCYCLQF